MELVVTVRLSSPDARNTVWVPVVVDAEDGGDAQRKALGVAQAAHPSRMVSGGTVYPATADTIESLEESLGCEAIRSKKRAKPRLAETRGVRRRKTEKPAVEAEAKEVENDDVE